MPKLYEVPQQSRIYTTVSDGSQWITFHHIDGMYSLCTTEKGAPCHLYAAANLIPRPDEPFAYDLVDDTPERR